MTSLNWIELFSFEPLFMLSFYLYCNFDLIIQFQHQDGEGEAEVIRIRKVQLKRTEQITNSLLHLISQTHRSTLLVLPLGLEAMEMSIDRADKCLDHRYSNPDTPIPPVISILLQLMLHHRLSFRWQSFYKMSETFIAFPYKK